jgi:transposase
VIGLGKGGGAVDKLDLFKLALGLGEPWRVTRTEFDPAAGRLDLYLDFPRGARFACPEPGCPRRECPVHDTEDKTWRHMDFFQHKAFLHARVPRSLCPQHGARQVALSWARPGSGFTLLFEALLLTMASAMAVARVAALVREHDTRIWRVLEHYVDQERAKLQMHRVERVGMDETQAGRGQDYVSVFMDMDERRVLFATEGRDSSTVERFAADLREHGGYPEAVAFTSSDMSKAFIAGIGEHLPNAEMTFDRYHVVAKANEAVDEVRRGEANHNPVLKKTRYLWLHNQSSLSAKQREQLAWLTRPSMRLATTRALRWREDFQDFYSKDADKAEDYLRAWCYGAKRSRLTPVKDFVRLVEKHWDGIVSWHMTQISNGLLEATNSLIQAAKARARGYRSKSKMITIVYLIGAKLPIPSPYVTHTT